MSLFPFSHCFGLIQIFVATAVADRTKYCTESCHHAKVAKLFPRLGNEFYHLIITLAICTRLLSQDIYINRWIGSTPRTHHGKSTSCVSMDCELTNFEHDVLCTS